MTLKILHLSTLDSGGAGKAALRLNSGLRNIGVESSMVVALKQSNDLSVAALESGDCGVLHDTNENYDRDLATLTGHWATLVTGYTNRPPGCEMFSDNTSFYRLHCINKIIEADVVNFHWVAGLFDCSQTVSLLRGKKIVWTLHDMNPFTGGCHYAGDCSKYRFKCGTCPQLGSLIDDDLSRHVWEQKWKAYRELDITVVTPSRWMADTAANSSLFSDIPIRVIPNGVPVDLYRPVPTADIRIKLNIPENAKIILFGADHLTSNRKGFVFLLEALSSYRPSLQDCPIYLAIFGKLGSGFTISTVFPVLNFGSLDNEEDIAALYSLADVFVLPSLEDNLPNTVLEAMACGTPVVAFNTGGIPDMISHKFNGFLASPRDAASLAEGIDWCLFGTSSREISQVCRNWVLDRYSCAIQSAAYAALYNELRISTSTSAIPQNNKVITVATSIAPKEIKKQQAAIATWLRLGLRILSLNNIDEISVLKLHFPDVIFFPVVRNAKEFVGKPLVLFDDVLNVLRNSDSDVCGIINSDIHLRADEQFPVFVAHEARGCFIYGSRVDITSLDKSTGTILNTGFDFFFFDPKVISLYPPTCFALGATWWDYWAVIIPLLCHYPVKKLVSPVAFHVIHPWNWSSAEWHYLGTKFSKYLSEFGFVFSLTNLQMSVFSFLDDIDYISPKLTYGPTESQYNEPDNQYLVSALVSTYNAEKFLRGCLQNLLDQTLYNQGKLEIIIINSGSQQNEGAIAREFMAVNPHIKYLRTERETLYSAWNRGVAQARGKYLTHANTDDRHRADAFEIMASTLDQNDVALVYCDALITRQPNETFDKNSATHYWLLPDFNIRQALLDCPFGCQVMWRASAHEAVGMFDGSYKRAGDYEFFLRLSLQLGALHLPEVLTLYHESMSNLSYESPEEVLLEVNSFIGIYRRKTPLEAIYPFLRVDMSTTARVAAQMDFANHLMGSGGVLYRDFYLAIELYIELLEKFSKDPDLIGNLAIAYICSGNLDNAISLLVANPSLSPRLAYYLTFLKQGKLPQISLVTPQHPGLAAMQLFKSNMETRVPRLNQNLSSHKSCKEFEPQETIKSSKSIGKIHVLYDISVLGLGELYESARTGIYRVVEHVVQGLVASPDIQLSFCATQSTTEQSPETITGCRQYLAKEIQFQHIPFFESGFPVVDIFHSPFHAIPNGIEAPVRFLTVYDLIPIMFPQFIPRNVTRLQQITFSQAKPDDQFICISHATQKDLCHIVGVASERVTVTHLAADTVIFYPCTDEQVLTTIRSKYNIGNTPYILSLCTLEPRKNIDHVIRAFARLVRNGLIGDTCLVLTGTKGWDFNRIFSEIDNNPELDKRIVFTGFVPDSDLAALYSGSLAFVYMSRYEGFGLPPLEAMQCGVPVITSNTSSLPEVVNNAGIMLDPDDLDELCRSIQEVYQNPALRRFMSAESIKQASTFSWEKCVSQTITAYKSALSSDKR